MSKNLECLLFKVVFWNTEVLIFQKDPLMSFTRYFALKKKKWEPKDLIPLGAGQAKWDLPAVLCCLWKGTGMRSFNFFFFFFELLFNENSHYKHGLEHLFPVVFCDPINLSVSFSFSDAFCVSPTVVCRNFSLNNHRNLLRLS